jgi:hypothetical protein
MPAPPAYDRRLAFLINCLPVPIDPYCAEQAVELSLRLRDVIVPISSCHIADLACDIVATDFENQGKMGKNRCIKDQYQ